MKWKISIGEFWGIKVYIHTTFLLLLLWVALNLWSKGNSIGGAFVGIVSISSIFLCIVLHEFGHALAARKFGIATRDIILLPIGGVARVERMPREPRQELFIALAGPAVNLIIAGSLYLFLVISSTFAPLSNVTLFSGPFLEWLVMINLFLMAFNLIPAFPMDGGRILRAGLAMKCNYVQATQRAAHLGQGLAFLFGLIGLMIGNPMLLLIAFFVWIGAAQEAKFVRLQATVHGKAPFANLPD